MAGFSKIYIIGGSGGFLGSDGVNPIIVQILVGRSDGEWLEVNYFDSKYDVFYEREKYPFLTEEFNSKDYGYNYLVKIYRIDFKEFDRLKIEN